MPFDYEELYDAHAAAAGSDEEIVGTGDPFEVGAVELAVLRTAGLRRTDSLVDFGCGVGRLALHAIPYLDGGCYHGIEISEGILARARENTARYCPQPPCTVAWSHHTDTTLPLPDRSADLVCAFSVFTHMEHEDSYRYLTDAVRVVRPGGRLVFSCLPLGELELAREVFEGSAALPLPERWRRVRNVVTSRDLIGAVAELAGWRVAAWFDAEHVFDPASVAARRTLGQAVCILDRPG